MLFMETGKWNFRQSKVTIIRVLAAMILIGFGVLQEQWLLLVPAIVLLYLARHDYLCVICQAGFCKK